MTTVDRAADDRSWIGLSVAWLVALVATFGSLYFSEVRLFVPCTLCWYQRILMYPLALLLGVAAWTADRTVVRYVLPMSTLGFLVATFHVLEQKIPGFGLPGACRGGVPCSAAYIDWFGFVTIPVLSATAFLLITLVTAWVAFRGRTPPST